jgi:hypothetical protein
MANAPEVMLRGIDLTAEVLIKLLPIHFKRSTDMCNRLMLVTETCQVFRKIRVRHTNLTKNQLSNNIEKIDSTTTY